MTSAATMLPREATMSPYPVFAALQDHQSFVPSIGWIVPFVGMLLSIALLPIIVPNWWHSNLNRFKVAMLCGLPVIGLFAFHGDWSTIYHTMHEYLSFLLLLGALYTTSAGVVLRGDLKATPLVNLTFLTVGAIFASFMGTTGAALLLIRPLLKTNSEREYSVHTIVFFIFIVCNVGGCLTPLGDPPLFLGYLRGVPFAWTFSLTLPWLFTNVILLLMYLVLDTIMWNREDFYHKLHERVDVRPLRVAGLKNFVWIGLVLFSVAFLTAPRIAQAFNLPENAFLATWGRDISLVFIAFCSFLSTPVEYRSANDFTWKPMLEVAALFSGIFMSMMATVRLLGIHGGELGLQTSSDFFWLTGILSAFLDNAPTYVVFFEIARSLGDGSGVAGVAPALLTGISLGAVFFGALTYIGNAPNFMVKAIAEENKMKMPSFFSYLGYSCVCLLPVFWVVTRIFLD